MDQNAFWYMLMFIWGLLSAWAVIRGLEDRS